MVKYVILIQLSASNLLKDHYPRTKRISIPLHKTNGLTLDMQSSTRTPLSTVDTNQFSSHSIKSRLSWNQNQTGTNSGVVVRDLDSAIGFKSVDVTLHKDEENVPSSAHHQGNSESQTLFDHNNHGSSTKTTIESETKKRGRGPSV
ncbi:hypothetical protein ACET3Z_000650 [Daucus carota]